MNALRGWLLGAVTAVLLAAGLAAPPVTAAASTAASGPSINSNVAATPSLRWADCANSNRYRTWVNIDIITMVGVEDWCFGGTGDWIFTQPRDTVVQFCSGNNYGTFKYRRTFNGPIITLIFPPGYVQRNVTWYPVHLHVNGWRGGFQCPYS